MAQLKDTIITGNAEIRGSALIKQNLEVTGDTTIQGNLSIDKNADFHSMVTVDDTLVIATTAKDSENLILEIGTDHSERAPGCYIQAFDKTGDGEAKKLQLNPAGGDVELGNPSISSATKCNGDLSVLGNIELKEFKSIGGTMADNDHWRIHGNRSNATNKGILYIDMDDDGRDTTHGESFLIRKFNGTFDKNDIAASLTLLDNSNDSSFPGRINSKKGVTIDRADSSGSSTEYDDLTTYTYNNAHYIRFAYTTDPTIKDDRNSWRVGFDSRGDGNNNKFVIKSTKNDAGDWREALTINQNTLSATFGGSITTSSSFIGNLTGNADTATKATCDGNGNNIVNTYSPIGHTHDVGAITTGILPVDRGGTGCSSLSLLKNNMKLYFNAPEQLRNNKLHSPGYYYISSTVEGSGVEYGRLCYWPGSYTTQYPAGGGVVFTIASNGVVTGPEGQTIKVATLATT